MTAWPRERVGTLGTWFGGGTPSKSRPDFWHDGSVPWLSPKDMGAEVLAGTIDHITEAAVSRSATRLVPPNSVAVVVRSGILERTIPVAVVPFATTLNQDMKALSCRPGIDPRWVAWAVRAAEPDLLRTARKAGTTVASLEWSRFLDWQIPVPPIVEQQRLLHVLEDHLSRLDAADRGLSDAIHRSRSLEAAQLARAVEVAARHAETRVLESVARVGTGTTPRRGDLRYWEGGTIPWVTSGELSQGIIHRASQAITQTALAETSARIWPAGTLLVAMYGEGKTRGTVGELALAATTNQACAAIALHDTAPAVRAWIRLVLESRYQEMRRAATGGVQPNLNLRHFRAMTVPWPARPVMEAAVTEMSEGRERVRSTVAVIEEAAVRSTLLRRALLAAAFSGRLTGRSSDLELAEELVDA